MLKFIKPLADTVCLYHPFGGLGDHLQHSTLPRLFSSINKKVFISTKCKFSNEEIKELVWERNPYVSGFSDMTPNIGMECSAVQKKAIKIWQKTSNSISNIEAAHGFDRVPFSKPEIHYKPNKIYKVEKSLIFDCNASTNHEYSNKKEALLEIIKNKFPEHTIHFIKSKKLSYSEEKDSINDQKTIYVDSIFEYCDYIFSCDVFFCLLSGAHSLAQAIRINKSFCIVQKDLFNIHFEKGLFLSDNISYITTE